MLRKIIQIDQETCNGCGLCAQACHEGAIAMIDGKAKLIRDDYCDGLGDCLPACPVNAISFEMREAAAYDAEAVKKHMEARQQSQPLACGCPGTQVRSLGEKHSAPAAAPADSALTQWPVQIQLVPVNAPYFANAHLLVAADCTAFAYGNFHADFIRGRVAVIGCPKLDDADYAEKLTEIFRQNQIESVLVARMEVPCCGGIEHAVKTAIAASGKDIPCQVKTIGIEGGIL